jgi:hypothetical protein
MPKERKIYDLNVVYFIYQIEIRSDQRINY